jgi:hypothetical protein
VEAPRNLILGHLDRVLAVPVDFGFVIESIPAKEE